MNFSRDVPHNKSAFNVPLRADLMDKLFDQKTSAKLLGISVRTLERHRVAGTGPRYARLGRLIRYREGDLDAWVQGSLRASTSEAPRGHIR